jgi:glycosyltransferase involved in cell wall biosynthesis
MDKRMITVTHVLPESGTGGAEIAAERFANAKLDSIRARTFYPIQNTAQMKLVNMFLFLRNMGKMLFEPKPDIIIFSLWRCTILLPLFYLVSRRVRLVLFLHSDRDAHLLDTIGTRLGAWLADEIWTDARRNIDTRLPNYRGKVRQISFYFPLANPPRVDIRPRPRFIFWGRLHELKNLARAVRFMALIRQHFEDAHFLIIGPDRGATGGIRREIAALSLTDNVEIVGETPLDEIIARAGDFSFFLLTSSQEGACMSVIEAMQTGLVPVATTVGDIPTYCRDGENAVLLGDDDEASAESVARLIRDPTRYAAFQVSARAVWQNRPTYIESKSDAVRALASSSR